MKSFVNIFKLYSYEFESFVINYKQTMCPIEKQNTLLDSSLKYLGAPFSCFKPFFKQLNNLLIISNFIAMDWKLL